jgi:hypothetical protein
MADRKSGAHGGGFVIVPNARTLKKSPKQSAKAASALIEHATTKNRKSRNYDLLTKGNATSVVVTSKDTGLVVSEFSLVGAPKKARLRKFKAKTRAGTISPDRIFKAI